MGTLYIVGTGPGDIRHLTDSARTALAEATVIVGYDTYIEQIAPLTVGKHVVATGMMQEIERCREAISLASKGETVALVSGGDSGIYGMAGLVFELLELDGTDENGANRPDVQVIPGISAVQAAAAILGAPLMHDFAVISLSDLLTPWKLITDRLVAAAGADFVIALYNPRSKSRITQIQEAQRIILAARPESTPVGIVRHANRAQQTSRVTTLGDMLDHDIDMATIVIIGNSNTFVDRSGRMVTPRGYAGKIDATSPAAPELLTQAPVRPDAGAIMFCGTASDVGKSVITAGLCRYLVKHGISVAPFKSQNMSLNSFVTPEGGEIGRAQAMQAQACDINPHTDMNPVLLKPNSDTGCQVVVQGRPVGNMSIAEYDAFKPTVLEKVWQSFERLREAYECVVIEGAGSISEINLKHNDIANLKVALMARCPVILVADIDRGGVFAQIVGTLELLEPHERRYIKGVIINKFRGDLSVLTPGLDYIRERTGVPVLGVLPWMNDLTLPAEDSMALSNRSKVVNIITGHKRIHVGVIKLPRISNFTDVDPLKIEPDVSVSFVELPEQLEGLDVLIIPGSKATISDLYFLMERGLYDAIQQFKGHIIGICGGYQMLGRVVTDPNGIESSVKEAQGLGLLPLQTEILQEKETHQALAYLEEAGLQIAPDCNGVLTGYEIHMGQSTLIGSIRTFARIFRRGETSVNIEDGAVSLNGRVFGTYLHGLFENARFREIYLNRIRLEKGMPLRRGPVKTQQHDPFDLLAERMEQHLDMRQLLDICGIPH